MDGDNDALVVDLPKERIDRFPGFDKDKFEKMSEGDLRRFNDDTCNATSLTVVAYPATEPFASQWDRPQYATPSWWTSEPALPERMGDAAFSAGVEYPPSKVAPVADRSDVRAYQAQQGNVQARATDRDIPAGAPKREDSPFFEGRAQPGDVIGLDTGGEQTHVGETAEDENKRREAAEEAARKNRG